MLDHLDGKTTEGARDQKDKRRVVTHCEEAQKGEAKKVEAGWSEEVKESKQIQTGRKHSGLKKETGRQEERLRSTYTHSQKSS